MVPLVKPALATLATFVFLAQWNDFLWPLIVINSESMRTITVGIAKLSRDGFYGLHVPALMAGASLSVLPTIVAFLLFQRYFTEGIVLTGLKS